MLTLHNETPPADMTDARLHVERHLVDPDPSVLRGLSASGELARLIPEWGRLTGARNIQHSTHHYPLDEHTFTVIERTRAASYYQTLTPYQQTVATWSALLHDIEKNTGPGRLAGHIPVDKLHPIKSAERSRDILMRLGAPPETIQRVYTLIHHHQAFGRLFILYRDQEAPQDPIRRIALKVRSHGVMQCLLALSEGDIRGVQRQDAFFTPRVDTLLADYARRAGAVLDAFRSGIGLMPLGLHRAKRPEWLDGDRSAALYLAAASWEELLAQVAQVDWGGAYWLPYSPRLSQLDVSRTPYVALFRVLPENIAYWGPAPSRPMPVELSMDVFYGLLWGDPLQPGRLKDTEQQLWDELHQAQASQRPVLDATAQAHGFRDWADLFNVVEASHFTPTLSPRLEHPALTQWCAHEASAPGLGALVTRPILQGVLTAGEPCPSVGRPWDQVPVYTMS